MEYQRDALDCGLDHNLGHAHRPKAREGTTSNALLHEAASCPPLCSVL